MTEFTDEHGGTWVATVREESTVRHFDRWYLVFRSAADGSRELAMPEVRWKTQATAERTLRTMSPFELRRRLHILLERNLTELGASPLTGGQIGRERERTNANAG